MSTLFFSMYNDPSHRFLWTSPSLYKDNTCCLGIHKCKRDFTYIRNLIAGRNWQYQKLCKSYCVHLWGTFWFTKYLQEITPDSILTDNSNFSCLIRRTIPQEELQLIQSTWLLSVKLKSGLQQINKSPPMF